MSNRTAKFLSALFASVLAGVPLGTMPQGAASAAEECLSAPKGASPEGSHWYYRIDRATTHHCWYLGQRDKPSRRARRTACFRRRPTGKSGRRTGSLGVRGPGDSCPKQPTHGEHPSHGTGMA
jgi:hypothetical protein